MKKQGVLHGELSKVIAEMGYHDTIMVGDASMPVPKGVDCIDLAVTKGVPELTKVLEVILGELNIASAIICSEMEEESPAMKAKIEGLLGDVKVTEFLNEQVMNLSKDCKVVVRTGEFTPFSSVILRAGRLF